jgi:hypothetical protein
MSQQVERPTAQDYADIFETNRQGARVFEDLVRRFYRAPAKSGGIDRILDSHEFMGRRQIIDFITNQINRANGVQEDQPQENDK